MNSECPNLNVEFKAILRVPGRAVEDYFLAHAAEPQADRRTTQPNRGNFAGRSRCVNAAEKTALARQQAAFRAVPHRSLVTPPNTHSRSRAWPYPPATMRSAPSCSATRIISSAAEASCWVRTSPLSLDPVALKVTHHVPDAPARRLVVLCDLDHANAVRCAKEW